MKPKKIKLHGGIRWEVDFYQNGRGTKRIRKRFLKKIEAEKFIVSFLKDKDERLKQEQDGFDLSLTFKTEVENWLRFKRKELSKSYLIRVEGILFHLLESYKDMPVLEFKPRLLSKIRFELLEDREPSTVNRWMAAIRSVISFSFSQGRIPYSPIQGFKQLKEIREEVNFWEATEISSFLRFAEKKYSKESPERWKYLAYLIALNTGVRAGELWGIKVKDFSFARSTLSIRRQILVVSREISNTKGKNERKVPCHEKILTEVKAEIQKRDLGAEDFIFTTRNGAPVDHNNFIPRVFKKDLKESKARTIRFHDLRHTALTMMVDSGINIRTVQAIAGHADIATTLRYVHALGSNIELVAKSHFLS